MLVAAAFTSQSAEAAASAADKSVLQPVAMSWAERCVVYWTALSGNWWMQFIDGSSHYEGMRAFDGLPASKHGADGLVSKHLAEAYNKWSSTAAWGVRWNETMLAQANAAMRGLTCSDDTCLGELYVNHFLPREPTAFATSAACLPDSSSAGQVLHNRMQWSRAAKREKASSLLLEYYADVDAALAPGGSWPAPPAHARMPAGVPAGFPRLARLFSSLAELHPFEDANSRVRYLLLQTEMVRLGGHPLSLEEVGWGVYYLDTQTKLEAALLDGWCAWEHIQRTGKSPYPADFDVDMSKPGQSNCCANVTATAASNESDVAATAVTLSYVKGCTPESHTTVHFDAASGTCLEAESLRQRSGYHNLKSV